VWSGGIKVVASWQTGCPFFSSHECSSTKLLLRTCRLIDRPAILFLSVVVTLQDILPFDHSRVVLPAIEGLEGSDFINANYLRNPRGECRVIAAQVLIPSSSFASLCA
jgi:hypothetical protein